MRTRANTQGCMQTTLAEMNIRLVCVFTGISILVGTIFSYRRCEDLLQVPTECVGLLRFDI